VNSNQWQVLLAHLEKIEGRLEQHLQQGDDVMSALSDLKDAIAALTTAVTDATAEITTLLGKIANPGTSDADVEAAVTQIQTIVNGLNQAVTAAQQAAP
jgi:hypothetical protein